MTRLFTHFGAKNTLPYPHESDNTMLFPMVLLVLFTLFVGAIGIPFNQEDKNLDILSKFLTPSINLLHEKSNNSVDWYEFIPNATLSVSLSYFGIVIASFLYKPVYLSLTKLNLLNLFVKGGPNKIFGDRIRNRIYDWSYNRGYIDTFYAISLARGLRGFAEFTHFLMRELLMELRTGWVFLVFCRRRHQMCRGRSPFFLSFIVFLLCIAFLFISSFLYLFHF